ncbi:fibronectin type III domain-containing protein [Gemmatimonadota bacterium]
MRRFNNMVGAMVAITLLTAGSCSGPDPDTKAPDTPIGLITNAGDGSVTLTWLAVAAGDLAGYHVYYQESSGGTEQKSALLIGTSYLASGLTNGVAYRFAVTSVDEAGNESDRTSEVTATPNDEVSLTAEGWTAWEAADYTTAEETFLSALGHNPNHAEAFTGLGWTSLKMGALQAAADRFDEAIAREPVDEDPRVGGLIAHRELQGGLPIAMAYGTAALSNDPAYVFSHDPSIDADLVRLMLAQVYFLNGETLFDEAQILLDLLVPGNALDPALPASWSVDGTIHTTYAAALLALIEYAFTLYGS